MFSRLRAAGRSVGCFLGVTHERGLVTALGDPSPAVRWSARQVLGGSDPKKVGPWLVEALESEDPNMRRGAADALRWAITPLAAWRVSRDPNALIAMAPFVRILEEEDDREMLVPAIDGLGVLGEHARPHADLLQRFLADPDEKIRVETVEALGLIGLSEADVLTRRMVEEQGARLGGAPLAFNAGDSVLEEPIDPALDAAVDAEDREGGRGVTARLILADWLQSRGHPRGELIVLQHAHAECLDVPRANELTRAIRRLFRRHRGSLLPPVAIPSGAFHLEWRAGFIDVVHHTVEGEDRFERIRAHRCARFLRRVDSVL